MDKDKDGVVTLEELRRHYKLRDPKKDDETAKKKQAAPEGAFFSLVYTHGKPNAQATALVDAFDNGQLDLMIASKGWVHLVRNNGHSKFDHFKTFRVDRANGWGLHDFNRDGRVDVFVAQHHKTKFDSWMNKGNGLFEVKNLGNETRGNTRNVLFADFDGDGYIDSYHSVSSFGTNHSGCELHPGKPGGEFGADIIEEVLDPAVPDFWYATANHPERGKEKWSNKMFKGAIVRDFDGDGKPDIVTGAYSDRGFQEGGRGGFGMKWVDKQDRGLFILHNKSRPGKIRFEEVAKSAIGPKAYGNTSKDWNPYSVVPIDYDHDGDFDLFVGAVVRGTGGHGKEDTVAVRFFENTSTRGTIRFIDRTRKAGFAHINTPKPSERAQRNFASGAPVDFDNDGYADLILVNRRSPDKTRFAYVHLFRGLQDGTFKEVSRLEHGLGGGSGGRDLCCGDLDGDGRVDVVLNDGAVGGYDGLDNTRIYANRVKNDNRWVKVRVTADDKGTPAIGTRVLIYKAGTKEIVGFDEVRTDFCYRSKRSPVLHFGLGKVKKIDIGLLTRGGQVKIARGLAANQEYPFNLKQPVPAQDIQPGKTRPKSDTSQESSDSSETRTNAPEIKRHLDVNYVRGKASDTKLQRLDIYAPKDAKKCPVMVYVHGGGWGRGDKRAVGCKPDFFVRQGYVFVSVNYRLVPKIEYPENIKDVVKALAWVHDNIAKYGGDPKWVFLMGHSAGAHLVALAGTDDRRLRAEGKDLRILKGVIPLDTNGYDIPAFVKETNSRMYLRAFGKDPKVWQDASPSAHVAKGKDIPPFLVFVADDIGKGERSEQFARALGNANVKAKVAYASKHDHRSLNQTLGRPGEKTTLEILKFLNALRGK